MWTPLPHGTLTQGFQRREELVYSVHQVCQYTKWFLGRRGLCNHCCVWDIQENWTRLCICSYPLNVSFCNVVCAAVYFPTKQLKTTQSMLLQLPPPTIALHCFANESSDMVTFGNSHEEADLCRNIPVAGCLSRGRIEHQEHNSRYYPALPTCQLTHASWWVRSLRSSILIGLTIGFDVVYDEC